ncbi:hypothetical protein NE848_08275 [Gramella jeungdoensis]|uniref:Uncharacterized protein n=1 Tax=Gramella jeungdoensis TaxID=708091 RepID=A0ABT0Z0Z5_9FLAO|nr:hypothetical protein [Gramella jeungdoensis]MCM8569372.1 hypothetical protein [Gramella jeungdoensis]
MKAFKVLFVLGSMLFMLTACEEPEDLNTQDKLTELNLQAKTSNHVGVPFKARLFTEQAEDALTEICSFTSPNDFWAMEHQIGGGNATHLGNFNVDFKFCFHIALDDQGFPDLESGFGQYNGSEGSTAPLIVAANGDQLFAEVREESELIPIQNEKYNFEFDDIWYITGGTGRFENASGEFVGYGLVRSDGTGTDHVWDGTIILNKN